MVLEQIYISFKKIENSETDPIRYKILENNKCISNQ